MKFLRYLVIASAIFAALPAQAQISSFKHIIIIVQENRTPDNLFAAMCQQLGGPASCGSGAGQYDILTSGWKTVKGGTVNPQPVDLAIRWDIEHHHDPDWLAMCDLNQSGTACQMDGAATEHCKDKGTNGCATYKPAEFTYVQRYNNNYNPQWDVLGPYINLAQTYGWANLMFATNQGPSSPAHQFIYGGTSAPSAADDASGTYAAENLGVGNGPNGCLAPYGTTVPLITKGVENDQSSQYPCFQHQTLGTLFAWPSPSWRYYTTPGGDGVQEGSLWTAPNAILSECGVSNQNGGNNTSCTGPEFNLNVVIGPKHVLSDIQNCQLQSLSWVIPDGKYSDHAGIDTDAGPQWVAAIVNTIGSSACEGSTYWNDTAIIITWDDWGGWYDHEPPLLNTIQGYQLGFRVPLLVVSAYGVKNTGNSPRTCQPYINTDVLDFGSIANFVEGNFSGGWKATNEGQLGFADARALTRGQNGYGTQDLSDFLDLTQPACTFVPIATQSPYNANYFINDSSQPVAPDDE
jgi:Phosphoesterase family